MGLSINKLSKLLKNKEFLIKNIYNIGDLCVYLELIHINSGENLFLYIPSKYEIVSNEEYNESKLHYLEVDECGNVAKDYADSIDNEELEEKYDEIELDDSMDMDKEEDVEEYLTKKYKCPVSLKESNKEDINEIREIFRQLQRLKYCVKDTGYKLCIIYKYYLCCLKRDESYECYSVENMNINNKRRIIVSIDLETMYDKMNNMGKDIVNIRKGIYKVLDRNQRRHVNTLQQMMEYKANFSLLSTEVMNEKEKYNNYLYKLDSMMVKVVNSENNVLGEIVNIKNKYRDEGGVKTLYNDIEKGKLLSMKDRELHNIRETKQEIISNIMIVKSKLESLTLKIDQICFDNVVMMNKIIKNFEFLRKK
jgi:hypothetical protein